MLFYHRALTFLMKNRAIEIYIDFPCKFVKKKKNASYFKFVKKKKKIVNIKKQNVNI